MTLTDMLNSLSDDDRERLAASLSQIDFRIEDLESLSVLKVTLEGANFCGTVPSDMALSLWKLQTAYYKMVAQILHGSPSASLSSEEKEKHKLIFKIDKGSTNGIASIDGSIIDLASQALDKMGSWQTLLTIILICGTLLGYKWIAHLTEKKRVESEDAKEVERQETIRQIFESHKEIFKAALDAGREGRTAIIKGTTGITKAKIGAREYDEQSIEEIRRRAARVRATSSTEHLCITVDELDARDKENPTLVVHDKESDLVFKASLDLNPDDYSDYDKALDIVWNSARFADKYFWAEVTFTRRREKIVSASISAIALSEEDLPQLAEDPDD